MKKSNPVCLIHILDTLLKYSQNRWKKLQDHIVNVFGIYKAYWIYPGIQKVDLTTHICVASKDALPWRPSRQQYLVLLRSAHQNVSWDLPFRYQTHFSMACRCQQHFLYAPAIFSSALSVFWHGAIYRYKNIGWLS